MAGSTVTHVIFDMDGLLLDTEKFYTVAQSSVLAEYGKEFNWNLKAKIMGKKTLEAAQILIDDSGLQGVLSPAEFVAKRDTILEKLFPTSELLPGAERLIRHLARHGVPFCLATSSLQKYVDVKTQRHCELFRLFQHKITGDQVKNGKPDPEIFLAAAAAFQPPADPATCLVFEDAPTGIAAAKAAGMTAIMVPDPNLDSSLTAGADLVLASLSSFKPEDFGLPPFDEQDEAS